MALDQTTQAASTLDVNALFPNGTHPIAGDWVPARDGETIPMVNPATGETLAHVPRGGSADVADAVGAAEDAFPAWRDTSPSPPKWGPPGSAPMPGIVTFTAGMADKATGATFPIDGRA